jgi:acyl carrier protein
MISDAEIYKVFHSIFADVFMRDDISLSPTLQAKDVAGWDSFKHIEIVMATEEAFSVKFTSAELDNLHKLGDIARVVSLRGTLPAK